MTEHHPHPQIDAKLRNRYGKGKPTLLPGKSKLSKKKVRQVVAKVRMQRIGKWLAWKCENADDIDIAQEIMAMLRSYTKTKVQLP